LLESTLCSLQWKISEKIHDLVHRVGALEGAKSPASKPRDQEAATRASRLHYGPLVERLDTLAVSMTNLEARF